MLAACSARLAARRLGIADRCFSITLLERNRKPGAKIAISGGGHCNLTHDGPVEELLGEGFVDGAERRFVKPSLYAFTNDDLRALLLKYGVATVARPDGRVFPVSGLAGDVVAAFRRMLDDIGAEVLTGVRVAHVAAGGGGFSIQTPTASHDADALVLAAGGSAWGSSGTTGDGVAFARSLGHHIEPVRPALAPVFFRKRPDPALVGVTLRGVGLILSSPSCKDSRVGDLLVSHRGISGPAPLSLSRSISACMLRGEAAPLLVADLFPRQDERELSAVLQERFASQGSRLVRTVLQQFPLAPRRLDGEAASSPTIPNVFVSEIMRRADVTTDQAAGTLTRKQRQQLVRSLKCFELGVVASVPLDRAEVSAGGISLREIDPKRMASRICSGLFCCGEVLDYAAEIGGFNLQAAFSTGWVAGKEAAAYLFAEPSSTGA